MPAVVTAWGPHEALARFPTAPCVLLHRVVLPRIVHWAEVASALKCLGYDGSLDLRPAHVSHLDRGTCEPVISLRAGLAPGFHASSHAVVHDVVSCLGAGPRVRILRSIRHWPRIGAGLNPLHMVFQQDPFSLTHR